MTVISNGIDTDIFRPSEELRQAHRTLLGFEVNTPVVGVLGRFDVAKGQLDFLGVFASVVAKLPSARAVLVGSCTDADRTELLRRAHSLGISASVDTFGESRHPEAVLNAIDVLALPSRTEGFPNVLAEAAACGTPAVAYDVGDVSSIAVAPCCVVPPGDERAFAEGLVRLLAEPPGLHERQALRRHIAARFSVARLLDMTEAALAACLVARERPGKGLTRESR
jgi:glycosyltransferase involved in cell wall biosynthesis